MLQIPVEVLSQWAGRLREINASGTTAEFVEGIIGTACYITRAQRGVFVLRNGPGELPLVANVHQDGAVPAWATDDVDQFLAAVATAREVGVPVQHLPAADPWPSCLCAGLLGLGGRSLGDLYLIDKPGGFTKADEALLSFVAAFTSNLVLARRAVQEAHDMSNELTAERRRLESLLDTVPGGIALTDVHGNYLFVNDGAAPLLARSSGDALSTPASDPSWAALWRDGRRRAPEDLPMVRAARGEVVRQDVIGLIEPDRTVRWLLVNATPNHDDNGEVVGAVAAFQDITELVELQRRAEASEARLKASQRVAGVGSWERDFRTGDLLWSEETYRLYGLDGSEPITAERAFELVHPDDRQKVWDASSASMRTGRTLTARHRIIRADGAIRVMAQRGEVILGSAGRPIKLLGTIHDVTDEEAEQERLQRAQQIESMGRLAGGLAHDLNNLLTVIGGHAGLLSIGADERALESTRAIVKAVDRAAGLMRQLLAVGRREVLQPVSIDINQLLESERINFRRVLAPGVEFDYELGQNLPNAFFDPGKLEQVLLNVILNAGDAVGAQGRVWVETSVRELDDAYAATHVEVNPGTYVCITVTDNGTGMSPDVLARALEPFYSTKPREKGSGLGLSTSAGVLSQAGGHLTLYSEEGRGTAVNIYVPTSDIDAEVADDSKTLPRLLGRGTVLVAEDDDQVRDLITVTLEGSGYDVIVGRDGEDALHAAGEYDGRIDLLITDVSMPRLGGHELAEALRLQRPGLQVLYVSGYTENSVVLSGIVSHGINFLSKPFSVKDLLATVHGLLGAD